MIRGNIISGPARALLDLLFPPACAACNAALAGAGDDDADFNAPAAAASGDSASLPGLCPACIETLPWLEPPFCAACAEPLPVGVPYLQLCAACRRDRPIYDFAICACWNRDPLRGLVHELKYSRMGRRLDIIAPLSHILLRTTRDERLAAAVREPADCLVIPVPMSSLRLRERGFNQAHLLAEKFSRQLGLPFADVLRRHRHTGSQTHLSREDRAQNLHDALSLKPRCAAQPHGKTCLIVDDILTTGSTLNACARIIKKAGAKRVIALAVGRTAHR